MLNFVEVAELWPKKQQFGRFLGLSSLYVTCKDGGTADTPQVQCQGQGHLASASEKCLSSWGPSSFLPLHVTWTGHWILASFLIDPVLFLASKLPRTEFLIETWRGRIFTLKEVNIL